MQQEEEKQEHRARLSRLPSNRLTNPLKNARATSGNDERLATDVREKERAADMERKIAALMSEDKVAADTARRRAAALASTFVNQVAAAMRIQRWWRKWYPRLQAKRRLAELVAMRERLQLVFSSEAPGQQNKGDGSSSPSRGVGGGTRDRGRVPGTGESWDAASVLDRDGQIRLAQRKIDSNAEFMWRQELARLVGIHVTEAKRMATEAVFPPLTEEERDRQLREFTHREMAHEGGEPSASTPPPLERRSSGTSRAGASFRFRPTGLVDVDQAPSPLTGNPFQILSYQAPSPQSPSAVFGSEHPTSSASDAPSSGARGFADRLMPSSGPGPAPLSTSPDRQRTPSNSSLSKAPTSLTVDPNLPHATPDDAVFSPTPSTSPMPGPRFALDREPSPAPARTPEKRRSVPMTQFAPADSIPSTRGPQVISGAVVGLQRNASGLGGSRSTPGTPDTFTQSFDRSLLFGSTSAGAPRAPNQTSLNSPLSRFLDKESGTERSMSPAAASNTGANGFARRPSGTPSRSQNGSVFSRLYDDAAQRRQSKGGARGSTPQAEDFSDLGAPPASPALTNPLVGVVRRSSGASARGGGDVSVSTEDFLFLRTSPSRLQNGSSAVEVPSGFVAPLARAIESVRASGDALSPMVTPKNLTRSPSNGGLAMGGPSFRYNLRDKPQPQPTSTGKESTRGVRNSAPTLATAFSFRTRK